MVVVFENGSILEARCVGDIAKKIAPKDSLAKEFTITAGCISGALIELDNRREVIRYFGSKMTA